MTPVDLLLPPTGLPRRRLTPAFARLACAIGLGLPLAVMAQAASAPSAKPALTVNVVMPTSAALPSVLAANGNIAAWQEALVGSESNGLRLAEVRAEVGDRVQRGQVLARFDAASTRAELAQLQAALAEAQANEAEAVSNGDRTRALRDTGALSAQQTQQALSAEAAAQA
ncbi:MAG: biotin/lipoyl-binding protein, partial [Leptothrix sp. (in: b-proteobacteria)]